MRNAIVVACLLALSCASAPPAGPSPAPRIWAGLAPGPYAVGYRTSWAQRPPEGFRFGPPHVVQVSAWYPARKGGSAMTLGDYFALMASEGAVQKLSAAVRTATVEGYVKVLISHGVAEKSASELMAMPVYSRSDASPLEQKFPLVFIAQGNGQPAASQAILAEFIASHGYVVLTTPSITRETGNMESIEQLGTKAAEQAADIEDAVRIAMSWENVAPTPVALVAHSFGTRGALLYAMHHPASAIVSLDGGIGSANGVTQMKSTAMFDAAAKLPPILHIYETNDAQLQPDLTFLRSLNASRLELQKMEVMAHPDFTTLGFASLLFPDVAAALGPAQGDALAVEVLATANRTLEFLAKSRS